jgi:hypothetical protein
MIIFLLSQNDPQTEPCNRVVRTFNLPDLLTDLAQRSPNHPLLALFQPIMEILGVANPDE